MWEWSPRSQQCFWTLGRGLGVPGRGLQDICQPGLCLPVPEGLLLFPPSSVQSGMRTTFPPAHWYLLFCFFISIPSPAPLFEERRALLCHLSSVSRTSCQPSVFCLSCHLRCCSCRGVNTFSPEGRLFQVEYAIEAIKLGSTAIGIQTSEGVCLAVEKRITSPLMEPSSIEKIVEIDSHIGCAMSGLIADAKTLIDKARVETQNHWFTYNETMTVESVTQAVSNLALQFGEEDADPGAMSRPFGVALLFGGVDEKGPQLFHMDPSGTFVQCDARAIGSASEGAQSSLQEVYHKSMTLKEAIKSSLVILKQVMEEKLNATNIELATVEPGMKFHMYTKEELEEVIKDI
uniref:Proteasome subunit alpha type-5 n=1 Tax=Pavo cristatus TaxID=9049 RepID=A0A8C9FX23_PAVCR